MARLLIQWLSASIAFTQVVALGPLRIRELMSRRDSETASNTNAPLECFQVQKPVLSEDGLVTGGTENPLAPYPYPDAPHCQLQLMNHHFGNSYGQPFVAEYKPPSCNFTRVVINFTVVSEGRQFDRLAVMYLGDVEVWRTSTAEPKPSPGIRWTYWKDMTTFLPLWKKPQTLIFDLGNLINEKYTGLFNTTLTATFLDDRIPRISGATPADMIIPISAKRSKEGKGSAFSYPGDKSSVSAKLPRNIERAVVSVAANGQAEEEFWWSNVPEDFVNVFNKTVGPLPGQGSVREVRLRIDGRLAGLTWPYPVIFTGGISPPLHRPVVGLEAFDLEEEEIDISPWLGVLCDGQQHTFSLEVVGADDAVVHNYWVLSAKIFVWLSKDEAPTIGEKPDVHVKINTDYADGNSVSDTFLEYTQHSVRKLDIYGRITIGNKTTDMNWSQDLTMVNNGSVEDHGDFQHVSAVYAGANKAVVDGYPNFFRGFAYPMFTSFLTKAPDGEYDLTIDANLTQKLKQVTTGKTVFPTGLDPFADKLKDIYAGTVVHNTRDGRALFHQSKNGSEGHGDTTQSYRFGARAYPHIDKLSFEMEPLLYGRDVELHNEIIDSDSQHVYGSDVKQQKYQGQDDSGDNAHMSEFAPLQFIGRGGTKPFFHLSEQGDSSP